MSYDSDLLARLEAQRDYEQEIKYRNLENVPVEPETTDYQPTEQMSENIKQPNKMSKNAEKNTDSPLVMEGSKVIDQKKALDVRVIRNPHDGFQIYIQSNLDWSFLRDPNKQMNQLGKVQCFYPKSDHLEGIPGFFVGNGWEADGYPNLWLLLAKDLPKGVVFSFGLIPVSEDKIVNWVARLKEQIKALYLTHLKPVNMSVTFSTTTVENDSHD